MQKLFIAILGFILFSHLTFAMTLEESIITAQKNNPSAIAAQKKSDAAWARFNQAMGAAFPSLKLEGSLGRSYSQPMTTQISTGSATQTFVFGTNAPSDSRGWTASASQPILVPAIFPGITIAQKGVDIAYEEVRRVAQEIEFNATQAYFGLLRAEKMVQFNEESKEMSSSHLQQVQLMLRAGTSTRADYLRTEVSYLNAELALTSAKNTLELAKDNFNNVLGRSLEEKIELYRDITEEAFTSAGYPEMLKIAFENRPDWMQYKLNQKISEDNIRLAQTGYMPSVVLSGQTGNRITDYPAYRSDVNSWTVMGLASWTIFDGLGTFNRVKEARANLETQIANEKQMKDKINLEVRDSYLSLKSALESISYAKKALESARENHKVSVLRFNSGVGINIEVIDAQFSLTQAKINYLQALYDVEIAKAKINKVVGKKIFS